MQEPQNFPILNKNFLCLLSYQKNLAFTLDSSSKSKKFFYSLLAHLFDFDSSVWHSRPIASFQSHLIVKNCQFVHTTHGDLFLTDSRSCQMLSLERLETKPIGGIQEPIRQKFAMVFHEFAVFLIGGNSEEKCEEDETLQKTLNTVTKINLITNKLEKIAPLNKARYEAQARVINNRVYVFSGYQNCLGGTKYMNSIEQYDQQQNEWKLIQINFNLYEYAICLNTVVNQGENGIIYFGSETNETLSHEIPELSITFKNINIGFKKIEYSSEDRSQYNFQYFENHDNYIYMLSDSQFIRFHDPTKEYVKLAGYKEGMKGDIGILGTAVVYLEKMVVEQKFAKENGKCLCF